MKEFKKINFKTSFAIVLSILIIGLTLLVYWIYFQTNSLVFLISGIILTVIVLLLSYYGFTSKVTLTRNEIISKTPFGIRKLKYSEIKILGVYAASNNYVYTLEKNKQDKWVFFEQKFIYLSTQPDYIPTTFSRKPKDVIDFHYRKYIYDYIDEKIKNAST